MMAIATGTALCLAGLPTPELPKITAGNLKTDTQKVSQFQKALQDVFDRNREYYNLTLHGSGQVQIIEYHLALALINANVKLFTRKEHILS